MNRRGMIGSVLAFLSWLVFGTKAHSVPTAMVHPAEQPYELWTKNGTVQVWVGSPMNRLTQQMHEDPAYAWSWHCNIAACAMDEGLSHAAANRTAARFMKLAFDMDSNACLRQMEIRSESMDDAQV